MRTLIAIFLSVIFLWGCQPDTGPSWDTQWFGPIANGELNINDLLEDSLTYTDQQNRVSLSYSKKMYSLKTDSFVSLPEDIGQVSYKIPFNLEVAPGAKFLDLTKSKKISTGNAELTKAGLDKGTIRLTTKSTFEVPVEYQYKFPSITKNGLPLTINETMPASSGGTQIITKEYKINNYQMDLKGQSGNKFNKIYYNIQANTASTADTIMVTPADSFALKAKFKNLRFNQLHGYFGQRSVDFKDSVKVNIFDDFQSGIIDFDSLSSKIRIENGLGADLGINIRSLKSQNQKTGTSVPLNADFIGQEITINRALKTSWNSQPVDISTKEIDLYTSNAEEFLENMPRHITYQMEVQMNPLGNISMGNDFYFQQYPLQVFFNLDMPLNIKMENLLLRKQINIEVDTTKDLYNSGILKLELTNYFPYGAKVNLFVTGAQLSDMEEITTGTNYLDAAIPDPQGTVTTPGKSIITLQINNEQYEMLKETGILVLEMELQTAGQGPVQIYDHYKINYQIKGNIVLRVNA